MEIYLVGGAVRDELLGLPVQDRDYVVVGATPEEMVRLGFRPVGRDFPVFLHPKTHEEYALARTERKSGQGYHGFTFYTAPTVTLEEDLRRRDLTINAMARAADGRLIDPFGGKADLQAGILRHVSPAFAEDPLRVLRVARFAARFQREPSEGLPESFSVASETQQLLRDMVVNGELATLAPERIWQELAKGLMEKHPERMVQILRTVGALAAVFPEWDQIFTAPLNTVTEEIQGDQRHLAGEAINQALVISAEENLSLVERFSLLYWGIMNAGTIFDRQQNLIPLRLPLPKTLLEAGRMLVTVTEHLNELAQLNHFVPEIYLDFLYKIDAWRKPERLALFSRLLPIGAVAYGWPLSVWAPMWQRLQRALVQTQALNFQQIALSTSGTGDQIASRVRAARLAAIADEG